MASLIALQIQNPDTRMINLSDSEVLRLMTFRGRFSDALIIGTAFNKTDITHWIE